MFYALMLILFFLGLFVLIGIAVSGPVYKGPRSDHFDGTRFLNPTGIKAKGLREVIKWMTSRDRNKWPRRMNEQPGPRPTPYIDEKVRITFVNHSSFLIQADGLNILTDPVWSERTSPFQWTGPGRTRPAGIKFDDLPKIDVVLVSHNHYDHFDLPTIRKINALHQPRFIVPLGVDLHLAKEGIYSAISMDWWQETPLASSGTITSVPAQHFSGRGAIDRDRTLWCGYVIQTKLKKIYFAGDTGYNPLTFKQIGSRFGGIDLSLIPIGAYKPAWFMSPIHCSPEEAVAIHKEVNSRISIATHFGTFPLADDGLEEPVVALRAALSNHGISPEEFVVLNEGVPFDLE